MVYPGKIKGRFVTLRSITMDDAEFSYNIRAEEKNRETVGQLAPSLEAQRKFIEWQMAEPDDYYFVVLNRKGERIGLIGIYDIHGDIGEVGREVNDGSAVEAMEAQVLLTDFAMDVLHLKRQCFVVYANNKRNLSNVRKSGTQPTRKGTRSGVESYFFEKNFSKDEKVRKLLSKIPDSFTD